MRTRRILAATVAAATTLIGAQTSMQQQPDVRGAWDVDGYVMKDGTRHATKGHILFTATDWNVLFFVLDPTGEVKRASAEGGFYTVDGAELALRHQYNLSAGKAMEGLPEAPLRMTVVEVDKASIEPTRAEIAGDRMTIRFPSGNRMVFRRRPNS